MTLTTSDRYSLQNSRLAFAFGNMFAGSRMLTLHALAMLICFLICLVLQGVDGRDLNGSNVWLKPAKFFLSLAVHFGTVAWALSFAAAATKSGRAVVWTSWAMVLSAWFELIYISLRASQAQASHFNVGTLLNAALYQLMALGAVVLVVGAAIIAFTIWRNTPRNLWTDAIFIGFGMSAALALVVGFTLGANTGHWIGGDMTDATGLPIFKWSTTGGDLRVSHFVGLHAAQAVPFAAISGKRSIVYGVALLVFLLTVATFVQAMNGVPLFKP